MNSDYFSYGDKRIHKELLAINFLDSYKLLQIMFNLEQILSNILFIRDE